MNCRCTYLQTKSVNLAVAITCVLIVFLGFQIFHHNNLVLNVRPLLITNEILKENDDLIIADDDKNKQSWDM